MHALALALLLVSCRDADLVVDPPEGDADTDLDSDIDTDSDVDSDVDSDIDSDTDVDTAPPSDADGDGFPRTNDCDDHNADVYPGAPETCNGIDDDCDSRVDDADDDVEGQRTWYTDTDGDGYGTEESTTACTQPPDTCSRSGDCDDADPTSNPGATDTPRDGVDQDCDGLVDGCPADTGDGYVVGEGETQTVLGGQTYVFTYRIITGTIWGCDAWCDDSWVGIWFGPGGSCITGHATKPVELGTSSSSTSLCLYAIDPGVPAETTCTWATSDGYWGVGVRIL